VINIDQQGSRRHGLAPTRRLLDTLRNDRAIQAAIPFAQSGGDEIQGVVTDAASLLGVLRHAGRDGGWSIGIGIGTVELHAESVHSSTGEAFFRARAAVDRAKRVPWRVGVEGDEWAAELERATALWLSLLARRTGAGWQVVDLGERGLSTAEIAKQLAVTEQAITKRLRTAEWRLDLEGRALVLRMGELALATASRDG
jgi:hypothetical protein